MVTRTALAGRLLLSSCWIVSLGALSLACSAPPTVTATPVPAPVVSVAIAEPESAVSAPLPPPPPPPPALSYGHQPVHDIDSICIGGGLVLLESFDPKLPARMREGANDSLHYQRRDEITFRRRFRVAHNAKALSLRTEATTFLGAVRKTLARQTNLKLSSGSAIDSKSSTFTTRNPVAVANAAGGPSTGAVAAEASGLVAFLRELPAKLPTGDVMVGALDKEIAHPLALQVGVTLQALTRALPSVDPIAASVSGTKTVDDIDVLMIAFEAKLTWPTKGAPWTAKIDGTAELRLLDGLVTGISATGDVTANDDGASGFEEGQFLQIYTVCRHDQRSAVTGGSK